ncbi:hypothetical protein [Thorsellia kenyensis]|uniref:Lipoprotein n=1 Tax=Thorsellia kenyensis TaxID=1549888 RepID=A0ABV6CE63_9GAMM
MNKKIKLLASLSAIAFLAGCATDVKDCDPNSGDVSLVTKFNCQYSGTYQKRIDDRQKQLTDETALNSELKSVVKELQQELNRQDMEFGEAKAINDAARGRLNNLLQNLKQKTSSSQSLQAQINEIETLVNQSPQSNSEIEKRLQLEELKSKVSQLEQDLGLGL